MNERLIGTRWRSGSWGFGDVRGASSIHFLPRPYMVFQNEKLYKFRAADLQPFTAYPTLEHSPTADLNIPSSLNHTQVEQSHFDIKIKYGGSDERVMCTESFSFHQ
jgi:hypothetical protein